MATDTETASPRFEAFDTWDDAETLASLWESQADAAAAVRAALPDIACAAAAAVPRLQSGARGNGRLVYAGAGTSGRLACLDGAELGPTFNWPEERLLLLLAGGERAMRIAVEGAEDDTEAAQCDIAAHAIDDADVVLGVAASARTPYTVACVTAARSQGALTIGIGNARGPLLDAAEHAVLVETGGEVIAGSTRLKAGTAQKMVLNLFSTLVMTRLGRVHAGRMVDMRLANAKLRRRAAAMVADLAACDIAAATTALDDADGRIKVAVLVARGLSAAAAESVLASHDFHLRPALRDLP